MFAEKQKVFVRNHSDRTPKKWIPATIIRKMDSRCYEDDTGNRLVKFHIDHILQNDT